MSQNDRYIPGVPCWVDTTQPDGEAAVAFYGGLFGWEARSPGSPEETGGYQLFTLRGKNVAVALNELKFTRKAAAPLVAKLLDSAIANAQQKNEGVDLDNLYIKLAFADKAPDRYMRRFRPRAQGRATRIVKGVSHLHLVLDERAEA